MWELVGRYRAAGGRDYNDMKLDVVREEDAEEEGETVAAFS